MQIGEILDDIMVATGWKQDRLSKKIMVSQSTISKWRSGEQTPNKRKWDIVENLIRTDARLSHLRHLVSPAPGQPASGVPVMGKIGAGSTIEPDFDQAAPEGLYDVSLPFPVPDEMIGLEVDGESMLPKYDPGDVVVVRREQHRSTESFIGELAAVRTLDGRRYLKTILQGTEGKYRLESFNAKPIENVVIVWVGEIHVIVPVSQVRRLSMQNKAKVARRNRAREKETAGMNRLPLQGVK